jgi:putative ABC transport system permease protein
MPDWKQGIRAHLRLDGLGPGRQEEIVEDLAGQLEDAWQDALARGMPAAEAEAFAWDQCPDWDRLSRDLGASRRGSIGTVALLREGAAERAAGGGILLGCVSDLLFALRMLRKTPAFTAAAVLTLALGIGANTAIFSVMNATLLKPLPFPDPDRVVLVWETDARNPDDINILSAPNFWDYQRLSRVFAHMAVFDSAGKGYGLGSGGPAREAEQVSGVRVTADFFAVLGVEPFLGRGFLPEEETRGKDRVVVLSYGLWERRYGADRGLIGRAIRIDGEDHTVVGVMPRGFEFQFWSGRRELWVPAGWTPGDYGRSSHSFVGIARLRPGVTLAQANADLGIIARGLAAQHEEDRGSGASARLLSSFGLERAQGISAALLMAVAFVLLIGCVNVANLMLARGAERRKEFAIRRALGASGGRLFRQILAESFVLSVLGGAAGLALAWWAARALTRILPSEFSFLPMRPLGDVTIDGWVVGFTVLITGAAGTIFGFAPALGAARGDIRQPLTEGGRESGSGARNLLRHSLVAAEVGLTLVVLAGAGLMVKSMTRLLAVDPGFDPRNVLTLEISQPQENLYYGPPGRPRFCQELTERVGGIPGVVSVGAAAHLPLRGNAGRGFSIEGHPEDPSGDGPGGAYTVACPGYFRTLGVPVLRGREFTAADTLSSPGVVVVNEALVRKYFANEDPLGKRIAIGQSAEPSWLTVVGVVRDVRHWGLANDVQAQIFRPYTQAAWPFMTIVVRTASAPASYDAAIRREMAAVEPDRPLSAAETMDAVVGGSVGARRFPMLMLAAFAALALVLAAVGIVGVVSYAVTQRTHEVGIRVALGARPGSVLWLIVAASMRWVAAGVAAGVVGALAVTRVLRQVLYEVKPADPWVLASVAALLAGVALVATYLPARRATRVDPLTALRSE